MAVVFRNLARSIAILSVLYGGTSFAQELRELYLSSRALGMGNTSVAIVRGLDAVWLNPAALAESDRQEVHYFPLVLEGAGDSYSAYKNQQAALSSPSTDAFNALMGYNNYARAQFAPGLMMRNFGFSYMLDGQFAFYGRNRAKPDITFGYQNTNGFQFAFGWSFMRRRQGLRKFKNADFRVGIAGKIIWRRGGYFQLPLTSLLDLASGRSLIAKVVGNYEMGIGADVGAQYDMPLGRYTKLKLGAVYLNVGDTGFSGKAQAIEGNVALGAGLVYSKGWLDATLSYDFRNILQDTDWRAKQNVGLEFDFGRIILQGGLSQSYLTGGLGIDFYFLRLDLSTHANELGSRIKQEPNRRYTIGFDMKFNI